MRFRKLRVAWSVFWGLAAVLLIVLWVRSYWWVDSVHVAKSYPAVCAWGDVYYKPIVYNRNPIHIVKHVFSPIRIVSFWNGDGKVFRIDGVAIPIWTLILPIAAIAAIPWLRFRFTLRTLLIATTLVALVFGLIVWLR
jgi:hypothetical protein